MSKKVKDCIRTFEKRQFSLKFNFTEFTKSILDELNNREVLAPAKFFGNNLKINEDSNYFNLRKDFYESLSEDLIKKLVDITSSKAQNVFFMDRDIGENERTKVIRYDSDVSNSIHRVRMVELFCDSEEKSEGGASNFYRSNEGAIYINPNGYLLNHWLPMSDSLEFTEKYLVTVLAHLFIHEYCHALMRCKQPYILDRDRFLTLTYGATASQVMGHCLEFKRANLYLHYLFGILTEEEFYDIALNTLDYSFESALMTRDPYAYENSFMTHRTFDMSSDEDKFLSTAEALMTKFVGIDLEFNNLADRQARFDDYFDDLANSAKYSVNIDQLGDGKPLSPKEFGGRLFFLKFLSFTRLPDEIFYTTDVGLEDFLKLLDKFENSSTRRFEGFLYKDEYPELHKRQIPKTVREFTNRHKEVEELVEFFISYFFESKYLDIDFVVQEDDNYEYFYEDTRVYISVKTEKSESLFDLEENTQTYQFYKGIAGGVKTITQFKSQESMDEISDLVDSAIKELEIFDQKRFVRAFSKEGMSDTDKIRLSLDFIANMFKHFHNRIPFIFKFESLQYTDAVFSYEGSKFVFSFMMKDEIEQTLVGDVSAFTEIQEARPNYASSMEGNFSDSKTKYLRFPEMLKFSQFSICKFGRYSNLFRIPRGDYDTVEYLLCQLKESKKEKFDDVFILDSLEALYVVKNKKTDSFEFLYYDGEILKPVSFSYGWWKIYA